VNRQRRRAIRDGLLAGGEIVNVVKGESGHLEALASCPERRRSALYLSDDPTIQVLRPTRGADGAQTAPALGEEELSHLRPAPRRIGRRDVDAPDAPLIDALPDFPATTEADVSL
jgi:hypothetical protein